MWKVLNNISDKRLALLLALLIPAGILVFFLPVMLVSNHQTTALLFTSLFLVLGALLFGGSYYFSISLLTSRRLSRNYLKRYQAIIQRSSEAILLVRPNCTILEANETGLRLLNFQPDPARSTNLKELLSFQPDLDAASLLQPQREGVVTEYHCTRHDGHILDVEIVISQIMDGETLALCLNIRDITERKQSEGLLRDSEELFRTSFENSTAGICLVSLDGRFLRTNQKLCELLGYSREELQQMHFNDVTHPGDREIGVHYIKKILSGETNQASFEKRYVHKNQKILFVNISTTIVRDQAGEPLYFVAYLLDFTEQKRAEDAIRTSEAKFRSYIEYAPLAVFVVDHAGNFLEFNHAAEELLGYASDTMSNFGIVDIISDEDRERALENFGTVLQQGYSVGEFNLKKQDGRLVCVSVRAVRLSDERVIGFCQDITERKQADAQMRYDAELLTTVKDAVIATDVNLQITSWNPGAEFIYGWKAAEVIGRSLPEVLQTEFNDTTRDAVLQTAIHGDEYRGELMQRRKDGVMIPIESTIRALRDGSGQITGLVGVNRDITGQVQAKQELLQYRDNLEELVKERTARLAESEANLRKYADEISDLYDNAPCGYHSLDINGMFVRINDTQLNWLGYTREEIVGKMKISDLMPPDGVALFHSGFAGFLQKGFVNNLELELIRKDGSIFLALINATMVYDAEGNFRVIRATVNDNSEHKQAEKVMRESKETAESANRAKSAFLANMSHEIRTPMNAVLGFAQLMLRDNTLTPDQRNHLETINRSGDHLLDLINEILEMSKIEANRVTLVPTSFDARALIADLEIMFRLRSNAKNLELRVEISEHLPRFILADKSKLTEVFVNLLGNAVKFTQHGMICWRINASPIENGNLRLVAEVQDTGPGIAQQEIDYLFKPFGQTSSGARVGGGTGLGLAISAKIAQLMGGDITVSSVEGQGSTFTVDVIVEPGIAEEREQAPSQKRVIRLKEVQEPLRILVVDDQAENRMLLVELLKEVGFVTHEAVNGAEAIHFFEQWHPHLILMDIRMPVMDGYDATRHIKATAPGARIPILAVTASAFSDEREKVFQAGADAYLRKPLNEHELFQAIQTSLNVEYLYEDEASTAMSKYPVAEATLSPEQLASLPDDLIAEIRQATLAANLDRLLAIIDRVAPRFPQLAVGLQQLARNYQYEQLLELLQGGK